MMMSATASPVKEIIIDTRFVIGENSDTKKSYEDSISVSKIVIYPNPSYGLLRIDIIGCPSFEGSFISTVDDLYNGDHEFHPVEQDANRRAFLYFNEHVDGFYDVDGYDNKGWDFEKNPLDINGTGTSNQIVDYKNPAHKLALTKLKISARWYDYASWIFPPLGPILVGSINTIDYYNK